MCPGVVTYCVGGDIGEVCYPQAFHGGFTPDEVMRIVFIAYENTGLKG